MSDLNNLSRPALAAAMRGGTAGWGAVGSSTDHIRYAELMVPASRKKCHCGCERRKTHRGMANGVCLTTACELGIRRWVKTGDVRAPSVIVQKDDAMTGTHKQPPTEAVFQFRKGVDK